MRRCEWCGVELRWWQLNSCRTCTWGYAYRVSPWCPEKSRWNETPDGGLGWRRTSAD